MGATEEQVRRRARVLTGFMSEPEAKGFGDSFAIDPSGFVDAWRANVSSRPPVAPSTAYAPPRIEDLPPEGLEHSVNLRANPLFEATYGSAAELKMVELRRLIAMQHWVDTDVSGGVHGSQMQEGIGGLLAKCLSPDDLNPSAQTRWTKMVIGNPIKPVLVVLTGFSLDNSYGLRRAEHDPKTNLVQLTLGSNANLMLVREFGGRYVLAQGYHRAWLLRSRGVEMVPVVVIHVPTPMDLTAPGFIQLPHLLSNRPPTVDDFFNDEVSVDVDVRAMMSTVKITIESSPAPRLL